MARSLGGTIPNTTMLKKNEANDKSQVWNETVITILVRIKGDIGTMKWEKLIPDVEEKMHGMDSNRF